MTSCGMSSNHIQGSVPDCGGNAAVSGLTLAAPAKLNVFLEILGKRPDGFHELETVMLRTQFADQLTVHPTSAAELTLQFSDATPDHLQTNIPLDGRNLILRAAAAVRDLLGVTTGARFILHKRIPPESGLGGGSSNAATALLLCRQLWSSGLEDAVLHRIAASLGSDINFLLSGCAAAVCRGRGEIIEPVSLHGRFYFVAVRPKPGNSTAAIFRSTSLAHGHVASDQTVDLLTGRQSGDLQSAVFNRMTEAARQVNPEMSLLMLQIERLTRRKVFMSGSGSTVFIVARSCSEAAAFQRQISKTLHRVVWILETA